MIAKWFCALGSGQATNTSGNARRPVASSHGATSALLHTGRTVKPSLSVELERLDEVCEPTIGVQRILEWIDAQKLDE